MTSVIIAAHDEEHVLGACIDAIVAQPGSAAVQVVVSANGCTDDTAGVARRRGATVVERAEAGKPGALNAADYREFILPHTRRIFEIVSARSSVPTIHFGVGTWSILAEMREAGGDVIGADWRTPLDEAWERNITPLGIPRGINALWTKGGLQYAPPIR